MKIDTTDIKILNILQRNGRITNSALANKIDMSPPPTLERVRFVIETPAYLHRKRGDEIDGSRGVLSLPVGSILHIRADANKPLQSVGMILDGKPVGNCVLDETAKTLRGSVKITGKNVSRALGLKFRLIDRAGYTNRRMEEYTLKVEADLPPQFRYFRTTGVGQEICPTARIPLHASAMDAYGVGEIRSWYTLTLPAVGEKSSEPSKPIAIGLSRPDQPQSVFSAKWELDIKPDAAKGEKGLPVGTVIAMQAECADGMPAEFQGPNRAKSTVLELRVISREELLGRLAARQKEVQLEFREQAIVQQNASLGKVEIIADNARKNDTASARVDLEEALSRQRISMTESQKAADTLEAVAMEMELNRLGQARPGQDREYDTIRKNIVSPLRDLVKLMRGVITKIDQAKAFATAGQLTSNADDIVAAQLKLAALMKEIEKQMGEMKSRLELARSLESILKISREIEEALKKEVDAGTEGMFNDDK